MVMLRNLIKHGLCSSTLCKETPVSALYKRDHGRVFVECTLFFLVTRRLINFKRVKRLAKEWLFSAIMIKVITEKSMFHSCSTTLYSV